MKDSNNPIEINPDTIKTWRFLKQKYQEAIVLLRIDENYLVLNKDAEIMQMITSLEITPCLQEEWQCIFPLHQLDTVLNKLVKAGYKVAVCDRI